MTDRDKRCQEAKQFERIHQAFVDGDLAALRAAVDDPALVPNGRLGDAIGTCLVYAIYHSPLAFIRTLIEVGADPNAPVDDGFPPLIAVLIKTREIPGSARRTDVDEVVRLLLAVGADPNVRGINDYTPLHMAVAERNIAAVQLLLDAGADPEIATRIDAQETPRQLAEAMDLPDVAAMLSRRGKPERRRLRSGLTLLSDLPGRGAVIGRQQNYRIRLRIWVNGGDMVRWKAPWGSVDVARLEDEGTTLVTEVRIDRRSLVNGLFYGVDGMRIGGTRRLEIAPHLGYGDRGVLGVIPPGAVLIAEITILDGPTR